MTHRWGLYQSTYIYVLYIHLFRYILIPDVTSRVRHGGHGIVLRRVRSSWIRFVVEFEGLWTSLFRRLGFSLHV